MAMFSLATTRIAWAQLPPHSLVPYEFLAATITLDDSFEVAAAQRVQ